MNNSDNSKPMVILQIPQNLNRDDMTDSIKKAFDLGFDAVRVGVCSIHDRFAVVSSEWNDSSAHDNEVNLLFVDDMLDLFPMVRFNLLLVEHGLKQVNEYAELLYRKDACARILTSVLYGKAARILKKKLPHDAIVYPFMKVVALYALYRSGLIYFRRKFIYKTVQTYESIGPSYLASQGFIRILKEKGVVVHVFVEEKEETIQRLFNAGVSGFIIKKEDYLPRLKEILENLE